MSGSRWRRNAMDAIDKDALTRSLAACRAENAGRRQQIDSMLADRPWETVAKFAAQCVQGRSLDLPPWQMPPCATHLESALRQPFGDTRGAREAGEILKKMLALGLSRFEPHPLAAIAEAEAKRQVGA